MKFLESMTLTDWVAWWGAILATLVLIWDIIKWKTSGPNLKLSVLTDMIMATTDTGVAVPQSEPMIAFEVVNRGTLPATITQVYFWHKNWWQRLLRIKPQVAHVVHKPEHFLDFRLPYPLEPGKIWQGRAIQNEYQSMLEQGYLYACVLHSGRKKPVSTRVKMKPSINNNSD